MEKQFSNSKAHRQDEKSAAKDDKEHTESAHGQLVKRGKINSRLYLKIIPFWSSSNDQPGTVPASKEALPENML